MAKLFNANNSIDPSQTNIPTKEQNQAEFLSIQKQSERMLDFQTQEYLGEQQKQQYADLNSASDSTPDLSIANDEYGQMANQDQNQDMGQQPQAEDADDINRSWASQFQESFVKGFGETVVGSTGDVINLLTAPLPGFSIAEGNILGRALREYGDEIGNEHTTFLKKQLEGQELTWGSLIDPDYWSTQGAEMLPMMIEFMVTGAGAGSAAKKGMGLFLESGAMNAMRASRAGGLLGESSLGVVNMGKKIATGVETIESVTGTGKGLAKYLAKDVNGVLKMSEFTNEFVNAAGAGLANNLLTGATNAMDYHRSMKAMNDEDIANGKEPRYTEDEMAKTAAWSMWQNLKYAPVDMLSWGISYAKAGEKIAGSLFKKIGIKSSDIIAKEASEAFTKTTFPVLKGILATAGHAVAEGAEETFQETYENWASETTKNKIVGGKEMTFTEALKDYWTYYNSKENQNTIIASAAMGGFMGGAMNLRINESAKKGLDYMNRYEMLTSAVDASDTGGQIAKTWHIRETMSDLLFNRKTESFDGFMSDQIKRGGVSVEEAENYLTEFEEVKNDYDAASALNVAGRHALIEYTIKAKGLEKIINKQQNDYDAQLAILENEFGEQDESVLDNQEKEQLKILKEKVIDNPDSQLHIDLLNKKMKDRNNSAVQQKFKKLKAQHEQQMDMMNLNLAQAQVNRLNLLSGKKADPLNIKFWVNQNGNEMAYIPGNAKANFDYSTNNSSPEASWEKQGNEFVRNDGFVNNKATTDNTQRGVLMDPSTMSEGQSEMAKNQGDIVSGMSETEYERFLKMTDDEIFENAKTNHENMLKNVKPEVKKWYEKAKNKGKEFAGKMKQKLNPDGTPATDANGVSVMVPDDSALEAKVDENLKKVPNDPGADVQLDGYQKDFINKGGDETFEEFEARKKTERVNAFLAKKEKNIKYDKDGNPINESETDGEVPEPTYQAVKDKVTGKWGMVDTATGNVREDGFKYSTSISAKKTDLGNASIVGDIAGLGWGAVKGTVKLGAKVVVAGANLATKGYTNGKESGKKLIKETKRSVEEIENDIKKKANEIKNNRTIQNNIEQNRMRKAIIEQAYYGSPARNNANNPTKPVSKQQLDAYLDTKTAAFKYGPRVIDEMYTINRMLKAKGIDVNVVAASNLVSLVGSPAIGYALASTIYIDENAWDQNEVFMHEMGHINYKLTQNSEETKAVVRAAREDSKLVEKIERLYSDKVIYKDVEGNEVSLLDLVNHFTTPIDIETQEEVNKNWEEAIDIVGSVEAVLNKQGYTKAPVEEQSVINEELFTNFIQGPMAKNFNKALEPIKERRRQKITKGWWAHLRGKRFAFEPFAADIAIKINNGQNVNQNDLMDHIMNGFSESIANKDSDLFTGHGFASRVDMMNDAELENHNRITNAKTEQRRNYDPIAARQANALSRFDRYAKKIKEEIGLKMSTFSDIERQNEIDSQLSELEDALMEEGAFDDYESAKNITFRGATRILNSFTRSFNYVKRKRFLQEEKLASDFDEDQLIDREALVSEFYNLAFETKGNTNDFIHAIENSRIEEVWQFNQYMDKMHPNEKLMYLSSMAHVMGNQQTISAVKSVVNSEGKWEIHNALSETEKNKVDNHMANLEQAENDLFNNKTSIPSAQKYQYMLDAYKNVKNGVQTNEDYLAILRALAPYGVKFSELINNKTINMRGHNVNVKTLIDKMVHSGVMDNPKKPGSLYIYQARPFVEAIVDSNRKFTSYSVIQNAEGNMEPSKITNNHLLSEINGMNEFLVANKNGKFPSFKSFKERYSHLSNPSNRTHENPVLRSIYDNAKNGVLRPSVSQYVGLTHLQDGNNSLYKNSTAFTQSIEDFMMFANVKNAASYVQTLSAMADSPRKFLMSVKRIKLEEAFKPRENGTNKRELSLTGKRMLESSWKIYEKSNENLAPTQKEKTIQSQEEYIEKFKESVKNEIALWNDNAKDLIENKTVSADYFKDGKLSSKGMDKITEFVFNQSVNGMALAEIFNPGIPFNDIVKRNKGNSSPVLTFGNKNLKMEAIPIDDTKVEAATNSGMYMTKNMAQKIVDAGLGVFDLNNGLKLLNYHVERDNPNFKGMAAYFKGYTTIISEETLITEPGLKGVFRLLTEREEVYNSYHRKKYGREPSLDLTNGDHNYINYAVPYSAVKSNFFSEEHKKGLSNITYDTLSKEAENFGESLKEDTPYDKIHDVLDSLYYGNDETGNSNFMGLSTNNFGPQQIMDKVTEEAVTPVQFISSVIVNGMVGNNLAMGEEIQSLIRKDMDDNLNEVISELGDMSPDKYKTFILKNLDLENMDQSQRLMIEQSLTNLYHPAIADFITNTLANRLKQAGNKLKTSGSVAQQKPSLHYKYRDGITVNGRSGLAGHTDRHNLDGSIGSQINEIVLPKHMEGKVQARQYLSIEDKQVQIIIGNRDNLQMETSKAKATGDYSEVLKEVALTIARVRHGKARPQGSYGHDVNDYIGQYEKDGVKGWFVRGETVIGTRIPSHGPASTGAFEAVDFLAGEGNQTIVHEDFSETAGSDYDGDSLFIQTKSKTGKNFKEALNKTVDLWTSPGMRMQTRAKIEFENEVKKVIGNNKSKKIMPMTPEYHRGSYNNTMISKRNIGIIFNTHRIANYLAAYNVQLSEPVIIDGIAADAFSDKEVGQESRNNKSAMLANIILDNAKWGFADALGLNDQTINQYSMLTNLGFSLQQLNDIMNTKAVKVWNKYQANNSNPYATTMKSSDVIKAIYNDLGINQEKVQTIGITTDRMLVNSKENAVQIIQLMQKLESINADVLHVSKIMAGHKGIENNPFILEQQLKDFEKVINSDMQYPNLTFPEGFKNNPDIKAYYENAKKILEVMKKANNIYSTSTSELIELLNKKIGFDNTLDKNQMKRASDLIKRFNTSRILGLHNISSEEKLALKEKAFRNVKSYIDKLEGDLLPGNRKATALDKSILFNRALNMNIIFASGQKNLSDANPNKKFNEGSYISANPRFFNESLTDQDYKAVQEEWKALPEEIKDGLINLDLMKNGLTGKLSLSAVFDERTNADISTYSAHASKTKNIPIHEKVMDKLENLIISNEFNTNKSILNATNPKTKYKQGESLLGYITENNTSLAKALKIGSGMIFKVDNKPYIFDGISQEEHAKIRRDYKSYTDRMSIINNLLATRMHSFEKFQGDINLEVISLSDKNENSRPLYRSRLPNESEQNKFMSKATEVFNNSKKKIDSELGNASRIDYHNYNDVTPLNQREFNVAMEYELNMNDDQKALVYKQYLADKKEANDLTSKFNQTSFSKMTDAELTNTYHAFAPKDVYAYSIITTPLVMELANRASIEQSNLTGMFEDGKDISLLDSYLNNNNISSNHPVTQRLVRKLNDEYKKFVVQRSKYIKAINVVTDNLYKEKFGLSGNSFVSTIQRIGQSLFKNRTEVYQKLYGNLLSEETYKDAKGVVKKEMKFKDEAEITKLYNSDKISKAEYEFYTTFRKITGHLKNFDGNDKVRKGYIPHTSMNNFEMYANRGLLGLMVNSKGIDSVINDVKVFTEITGKKELMTFEDIKNHYNALAHSKKQTAKDLLAFEKLKRTAKKLQKTGKNEDGSRIVYSNMQNETLLGMSPMSRFASSRSNKAELMPSMDLNKALVEYVHSTLFTNGDESFSGFKSMMPMIDGVMAYNDKNGYKNAYNYVKEVVKEGFIMKKDQVTFNKTTDSVINGLVKGNTLYALGYKGLLIGKGLYAIGNIAAGKYMNIKRNGGKEWITGEARYWGIDKGISLNMLDRRQRADKILNNLGYVEPDFYDDVNVETKSGIDNVFTKLALFPMTVSENWIQKVQILGMLTKEEYDLFDENGDYKTGSVHILSERIHKIEERVKTSQGKGFSPTDQSRVHQYAVGRMFMQFSRHIPSQLRERFAKEDIDMNGVKYIGSLRQVGKTAVDIFNNRMTPVKFKEYYATLEAHEKEALLSGLRGVALMTVLGFIAGNSTEESQMINSKTDASAVASGVMSDSNIWFDADRMGLKAIPPAIRSTMSALKILTRGEKEE